MPHFCPAQGVDQNRKAPSVVHHEGHHVGQELPGCPNLMTIFDDGDKFDDDDDGDD